MIKKIQISLMVVGLISSTALIGLFDEMNQNLTQSCYQNVNVNINAGAGALVQVALGSCYMSALQIASMGKAGDIKQFTNLPPAIALGKVAPGTINSVTNIAMPAAGEQSVISFIPSTGMLANVQERFLIERVTAANFNQEIAARGLQGAVAQLQEANPGKQLDLLVFYRNIPGIEAGWKDLGQVVSVVDQIDPMFNVAVNSLGKLMLYSNTGNGVTLFDFSQFQISPIGTKQTDAQAVINGFNDLIKFKQVQTK